MGIPGSLQAVAREPERHQTHIVSIYGMNFFRNKHAYIQEVSFIASFLSSLSDFFDSFVKHKWLLTEAKRCGHALLNQYEQVYLYNVQIKYLLLLPSFLSFIN